MDGRDKTPDKQRTGYIANLVKLLRSQKSCGWVLEIVSPAANTVGFKVLPRRWVVERTFGWLGRHRRHSKDYETLTDSSEAHITIVRAIELCKFIPRLA